jgi:superfamily II DNA/RNA helicase
MTETWPILTSMKPFLQENWMKAGFEKPTAIQLQTTHLIIEGKDVIAQAPTGTGKTLAYLIPVLEKVDKGKGHIQAVILASSHELVMQINQEIQKWGEGSGISGAAFIGGANVKRQIEKLKKHPQIIVGTPGRVNELIKVKKIKMHEVKIIILDEGDQLLVPEHVNTVKSIVKSAQRDRQMLLFSATIDGTTEKIARGFMNEPELIIVEKDEMVEAKVDHLYFVCELRSKFDILGKLARIKNIKGLAFIRDIGNLTVMAEKLQYKGISLGVLHSDAKKAERETSLKNFRSGKSPLLLATDVAARGLDITEVTHVINVDIPNDLTQYVHRAGRTGRLGSTTGTVISIVTEREERTLKQYAKELGVVLHKQVFYQGQMQGM